MNKQEQSDLCRLLAKLRYDIMEMMVSTKTEVVKSEQTKMIEAINKILVYTYIDGKNQ